MALSGHLPSAGGMGAEPLAEVSGFQPEPEVKEQPREAEGSLLVG